MKNYKTKGIILKRTNLGETDRIVTIFSENCGKIKAVAKGVRKTLSKLAGHLELFCLTDFVIAEGKNLDTIIGAEIIKCFINLRGNLSSTNTAYYLAEIVDGLTVENEKHPEIFELLGEVLEHLDNGQNKLMLSYFEVNFLAESGFSPELYKCVSCLKKLTLDDNYFSFREGGVVCAKCQAGDPIISNHVIKALRLFLRHRISIINKIKTNKKLTKEIVEISQDYLSHIAQKEFKAKRFLKNC